MKKILQIILSTFIIYSCSSSSNDDDAAKNNYQGNWSGTYSGTDQGNWNVTVSNDGKASGIAHSSVYNQNFDINGTVDNSGQLNAVLGTSSSGGNFKGTLTNTSGNGTWLNNIGKPHSGSWSGNRN